jgi:phosphocarrier protein HPr
MQSGKVEASVLMTNPTGLHARPAVKLTKLAKTFKSHVHILPLGYSEWVDAKSIVKVMGLKAPRNTALAIKAEGEDAKAAVAALVALVERNFDERHEDRDASDAGAG